MIPAPPALGPRSGSVLGTSLYPVSVADEREILLVSDLHLHPAEPQHTQAFRQLLSSVPDGGLVLILGDLFDYWVGRPQLRSPEWRPVLDAIVATTQRQVRIYVLHGNRDFQLDRGFERFTGARVVAGGLWLETGDRPLVCLHGDELCQNDLPYQRSKRWLRSPPLRFVFHRLPFSVSNRLAGKARSASKKSVARADPESLKPSARALMRLRDLGDVDLLFGHIHIATHGPLPGDGRDLDFYVLPDFESERRGHALWTPGSKPRFVVCEAEKKWPDTPVLGH